MCIYFLPPNCPTAGFDAAMPSSCLYVPSRRTSTQEATSSIPSLMSSRSSITTMSSSDSLNELANIEENAAFHTTYPIKHFHKATSSESETANMTARNSAVNDYVTAVNTLTNILETKAGVQVGLCIDPTSTLPSQCKNLQIRHRSSPKRQTGYFDNCVMCTKIGKLWQESRGNEDVTSEQLNQTSSRGQKVKKAETGMCSTKGCEACRPVQS